MRVGFLGATGNGKTAMLMVMIYDFQKENKRKIFSNIWNKYKYRKIPNKFYLDYTVLNKEFINSIMIIDELHVYYNARNPNSLENKNLNQFLMQSRKRENSDVLTTFQTMRQIDIIGRENFELLVICEAINVVYKDKLRLIKERFDCKTTWFYMNQGTILRTEYKVCTWEKMQKYFSHYNTNEMVHYARDPPEPKPKKDKN